MFLAAYTYLLTFITVLLSLAFQAVPEQVPEIIELVLRIATLVMSIIGFTGGLRGALEWLNIRLKGQGALTLSWVVGLVLTVVSVYSGWLPAPEWTLGGVYAWVMTYWPTVTAIANTVRDMVYNDQRSTPIHNARRQ